MLNSSVLCYNVNCQFECVTLFATVFASFLSRLLPSLSSCSLPFHLHILSASYYVCIVDLNIPTEDAACTVTLQQ